MRHVSPSVRCQADVERYKEIAQRVLPLVGDTVELINDAWEDGKRILIEGANATMLDLDFGTYPFVTSSNPSIGGVASGLGLAPTKFQAIIGVVRPAALCMRLLTTVLQVSFAVCYSSLCMSHLLSATLMGRHL